MSSASGLVPGKYARVEREWRFLLAGLPDGMPPASARRITDRHLTSTSLRLRHISGLVVNSRRADRRARFGL